MRNHVSSPRVRAPRRAHKIAPALGGVVLSLMTGGLLYSFAENPPEPTLDVAELEPAGAGLRGSLLADIGPHAPTAFAPRSAGMRAQNLFIARAEAKPQSADQPWQAAEAPTPPARPAALETEKAAALEAATLDAPTPPRRPAELSVALKPEPPKEQAPSLAQDEPRAPARQMARAASGSTVVPAAPADGRSFFERLFGGAPQTASAVTPGRPNREVMAYAATPDTGGLFGGLRSAVAPANPAARFDRYTAVYDISARTVYMPDGARLEAHSGLREHLDDPRYVHLRMRGPTPPHLYMLTPREALFHGVEALRLTPVGGEGAIFGRAGLLAHTYMLGPNGDSNGCVSFRDYNAFLQAYKRGEVRRLAVVAHL
ncbi:DUF2778 domain-containing protein [Methylocystis echinoides]|jgi:hypothetical protein|uniref:DUF2778 domain-containing protein n=1 Tax=Methylocystis echinoides TaxID=29468 RepID=UPI003416C6FC